MDALQLIRELRALGAHAVKLEHSEEKVHKIDVVFGPPPAAPMKKAEVPDSKADILDQLDEWSP